MNILSFDVRLNSRPTYWHCEPGWEWKAPPLPDHLLWYVVDGSGEARLDGQEWSLQAGSCFVFTPCAQPHCTQDPNHRLVVFGMHFDLLDRAGLALAPTTELLPPPGLVVRDTAFFATLAQRCEASYRHGDEIGAQQSRLYLRAMLLQLWEQVLHRAPSVVDRALDEVIRAIQREPGKRWSVDELAARVHLSRAQFVRRFRTVAGYSPAHFMIQVRLERARQLIQETNMTIGQIAGALGYDDVYFFSRQYKRYTGVAPSSLRRR